MGAVAAVIVGFMILRMGAVFCWDALRELMDEGVSELEVAAIRGTTAKITPAARTTKTPASSAGKTSSPSPKTAKSQSALPDTMPPDGSTSGPPITIAVPGLIILISRATASERSEFQQ